jgi:hypothetical protein
MPQCPIFISYSHKDNREKEKLLTQLGVLQNAGFIDVWSDSRIEAGEDWQRAMEQAMAAAKVAILFITANFLTSPFILREEIPKLLKRRKQEGLIIFPLIAKDCPWKQISWLTEMDVRPKDGMPIWGTNRRRIDEKLTTFAEEIADLIKVKLSTLDSQFKLAESSSAVRLNLNRWAYIAEGTSNPREKPSMLLDRVLTGSSPSEGDEPFRSLEHFLSAALGKGFDVEIHSEQHYAAEKISNVKDFWKALITLLALDPGRRGPLKWLIKETVEALRKNSLNAQSMIEIVWEHICQLYCDHSSSYYRDEALNSIVALAIASSREPPNWNHDLLYRFVTFLYEKLESDPASVSRIAEQLRYFDQELGNDAPPSYLESLKYLIGTGRAIAIHGTGDIPHFDTKLVVIAGSALCDYQFEAMVFPITVQDYSSLSGRLPSQLEDNLSHPFVFKIVSEEGHDLYNLLASEVMSIIRLVNGREPDDRFDWDIPTACEWLALADCENQSFPWGNDPPTPLRANLDFGAISKLRPVGTRLRGASKYGVQDCCGNVHEIVRISRGGVFPSDFRLAGGCYQTNVRVADCRVLRTFRKKKEDNRRNTAIRLIRYFKRDEGERYKAMQEFSST